MKKNWFVGFISAALWLYIGLLPLNFLLHSLSIIAGILNGNPKAAPFLGFTSLPARSCTHFIAIQVLCLNALLCVSIVFVLLQFKAIFTHLQKEQYFHQRNPLLLSRSGMAIIVIGIIYQLNSFILEQFPSSTVLWLMGAINLLSIPFNPFVIVGLIIYVFGIIMQRAAMLQQEQDLVV
ncbi:MAG: DUF2975 domain-containing protein [Ignavibacteria bacterium]|nr:DUF2975 domain-containing protein [Ignavibacteria bacterium]